MSGGLGFFVKNTIMNGVVIGKHYKDIIAWVILKGDFLGFDYDIYVGNVYLVPEGSTHENEELIALLYDQVKYVPINCEIILSGDYNARTNTGLDFNPNKMPGSDGELIRLLPDDIGDAPNLIGLL